MSLSFCWMLFRLFTQSASPVFTSTKPGLFCSVT